MSYYDIDPAPITNRHRKKRSHHGGLFYVGIAFIAFIVIGLTISLTIRACVHHKEYRIEDPKYDEAQYDEAASNDVDTKPNEVSNANANYVMPDSIIRICTPSPLNGISEQIIQRTSYITSYNKDTKIPNWVAWNLSAEHTDGPYGRLGNFHEDEDVPAPRATLDDYRGSGWSRGHMCPAGDNKWDGGAMFDTFSLVNVCPQNANLNSGLWNSIEMDCRRWARKFGDIYIVCGPIFMNREHAAIGGNKVLVPEAFFKVVLCLNGKPKAIGFIVRNTDGLNKRDLYHNSIDQVERITGMDFFPVLPDEIENAIEATADIDDWN